MAAREKSGYAGALVLLEAGEPERALDELERLRREQDPDLLWLGADPEWAPLRNHARFQALVRRVLGRR
jgi:hypothetical protein